MGTSLYAAMLVLLRLVWFLLAHFIAHSVESTAMFFFAQAHVIAHTIWMSKCRMYRNVHSAYLMRGII